MRAEEAVISDLYSAVEISIRVFGPRNPQTAVVCNEIYFVTDGYAVAD